MRIKLKYFFLGCVIAVGLLFGVVTTLPDGKLHLVFCDVGQGDAIYIRTPNGSDILIDAGPNDKVLACLGKHMPFYDRDIELAVLTHPHADHLTGLISVLDRYQVKEIVLENLYQQNETFKKFREAVANEQAIIYNPKAGDKIIVDGVELQTLWPIDIIGQKNIWEKDYLTKEKESVLGASTKSLDVNAFSIVLQIKFNDFKALLPGDAGSEILSKIFSLNSVDGNFDILKVPHHGSKTSLTTILLDQLKPKTAIISVGKNSFGHPAKEILSILGDKDIKILRTDKDGEVEITN